MDSEGVDEFAGLVTDPAGDIPYPYMVNDDAPDLLELCLFP